MTWPHVLALLLGGLAVIPVLYTLHTLSRRSAASTASGVPVSPSPFALSEPEEEDVSALAGPRRSAGRLTFGREDRRGERAAKRDADLRADGDSLGAPFEYTILPHRGTLRQNAPDLGGFTKVPFLLYDRVGNCVMVHRRVSLN